MNVRSLYTGGSLRAVARELAKCKLHPVPLQMSDGTRIAVSQQTIFIYGNGNANHEEHKLRVLRRTSGTKKRR
jgi:hypothetical protein